MTGHENILLVEDGDALRAMIREVLESDGYSVLEYAAPRAVVDEMGSLSRVDLLLTDVVLPGMSGPDLARHLRASHPHVKVVLMSGYADPPVAPSPVAEPASHFLQKPFTTEALLATVRAAMDGAGG